MRDAWFVEIRPFTEDETDAGFRRMEAQSERDAERISRGADINLNHAKYYTRIVRPTPTVSRPHCTTPETT